MHGYVLCVCVRILHMFEMLVLDVLDAEVHVFNMYYLHVIN